MVALKGRPKKQACNMQIHTMTGLNEHQLFFEKPILVCVDSVIWLFFIINSEHSSQRPKRVANNVSSYGRDMVQNGLGFMHSVSLKSHGPVVLLLLTFCLLLLPLWESVIVLCIVVRCFMSILVLQSS